MTVIDFPALAARTRSALVAVRECAQSFRTLAPATSADEVVRAFDQMDRPLSGQAQRVHLMAAVHPDDAVREEAREIEREISELSTELSLDRELYQRLAAVDAGALSDDTARRALEHALRDFRRSGVDKDDSTRARIVALREELVSLGQAFDKNIVDGGRTYWVERGHAGLSGLPQDFLASHPEAEDGRVALSTDPPDRLPVMVYAEDAELRREYSKACATRAYPVNIEVLQSILEKRHELAGLLGFASWADYVTEDKMTKCAATARSFVERVQALARPRFELELAELLEEKRMLDPAASDVRDYDRGFLVERVRRGRFQVNAQEVRAYFPFERVLSGVLNTASALYGVEFVVNTEEPRWHADVRVLDLMEEQQLVGRIFLDLHPREGKYKHAAMFDVQPGLAGETIPAGALVCNFSQPQGDDPALMEHDHVTTLFHEFGHLLHGLFAGRQSWRCFSGISCEWDFVEVPSQLFEEWAWDARVLASFTAHKHTGEPIPAELVERMKAAQEYGKSSGVLVQMTYASLSLGYHEGDPSELGVVERMLAIKRETAPFPHEEGTCMVASFGHLHGYSALYYTYMWSLAICKDLIASFGDDLMDTERARCYRRSVLEPGGARDARELVSEFLGRETTTEAFEAWLSV